MDAAEDGTKPSAPSIPPSPSPSPASSLPSLLSTIRPPLFPSPLLYQSCYCEENVYHLIRHLSSSLSAAAAAADSVVQEWDVHAVFISNPSKSVFLYHQQRSQLSDKGSPVVWDYHVIATATSSQGRTWVYDADSTLCRVYPRALPLSRALRAPCVPQAGLLPVELSQYNTGTFPATAPERFQPMFRVVPAETFLRHFASDRSHMRDERGEYHMPPPAWPPIVGEQAEKAGVENNLMQEYVDMTRQDEEKRYGEVYSAEEWLALECIPSSKSGS